MVETSRHSYEFAPFRLEPDERRLLRDGEPVALTPKCFDLLIVLVENSGHLLEKSDLLARVWPGQFVEEGSLSFNVSELRKALGEGQNGQRYIETVRKKGFRFVAPVVEVPAAAALAVTGEAERVEIPVASGVPSGRIEPSHRVSHRFAALAAIAAVVGAASLAYILWPRGPVTPMEGLPRTIAVLPFRPLVANIRDQPLEMGICNALINRLDGLGQLVVRPTSSVVTYNRMGLDPLAAGRELRVDALLDGYIQRSQDKIRVTARLLRTADGKSLWSGQFNENFTDILTVEDSISSQIVEALHLNLSGDEQRRVKKHSTDNIEAYELYLKGCYSQDMRTPEAVAKSIGYFQDATLKDPRYALAFAAMADSYAWLANRADMPPADSYQKARAAAMHALEIDATTAEAHSALANVKAWYEWDWLGAEREFKRAIELSSNNPIPNQQYASYLMVMGRHQEAVSEVTRAQRLSPLSIPITMQAVRVFYFGGQYEAAIAQCRRVIAMDPDFGGAHLFLGRIYTQKRQYREALAELERASTLLGGGAEVWGLIGYTHAVSGRTVEAQRVLVKLHGLPGRRTIPAYHIAMVYAGLGESDEAFEWLEKAYDDREGKMTILKFAPEFAGLRADPRFTKLLQRMKLI